MLKAVIADDDAVFSRYVQQCVDWQSMDIMVIGCAHNGMDTLELCRQHKPEILVLDVEMPLFSGLECLRRLRDEGIDSQVLLITGRDEFRYAQEGANLGVSDIQLKPVSAQNLEGRLRRLVNRYWALRIADCVLHSLVEKNETDEKVLALLEEKTPDGSALHFCRAILDALQNGTDEELHFCSMQYLNHIAGLSLSRTSQQYITIYPALVCSAFLHKTPVIAQRTPVDEELILLGGIKDAQDPTQIEGLLFDALQHTAAALHGKSTDVQNAAAEEALDYMRAHFAEPELSIAEIAEHMHFHETYLRRLFKMTFGKTPSQALREIRMNEARKLLEGGDVQVQKVSGLVGFEDPAYFSKCYRLFFGYPPSDSRMR